MVKKILIIAYDVAPLELISSQRVNHIIRYLARHRYSIDVLTSRKTSIDGPIGDYHNYQLLKEVANFHEVGKVRVGNNVASKVPAFRGILKKVRKPVVKLLGGLADYRTIWGGRAIRYFNANLSNNHYDVIISSSLPVVVNIIAAHVKKNNPQAKWISDHRDLWSLNHLLRYSSFSRWFDEKIEKWVLSRCDLITSVSEDLTKKMEKLHEKKCLVVRNGFVEDEFISVKPSREFLHENSGYLNIVYAGNIYKGRRDPRPLIDLIAESSLRRKFRFHFYGQYMHDLCDWIHKSDQFDLCKFYGYVPRNDVIGILKAADYSLFLESGALDATGVLTGKLFELLAVGNPIICLGPPKNFESVRMVDKCNLLVHFDDICLAGPELMLDLSRFKENDRIPVPISEFSRDGQVKKIVDYIQSHD